MPEFAPEASQLTDGDAPQGLARRRFLTFLVAAPALTMAARVGTEILAPAKADAAVPSPPQPADITDFGDVMTALTKAVYDGTDVDAEASFATGLDWVLDAVAAKLTRPSA